MKVPLSKGLVAEIDDADWPLVKDYKWCAMPRTDYVTHYAVSNGVRMHRLLMNPKANQIVDHVDGDGLNNKRLNLRIGTQAQNCINRKTTPGKFLRGARPRGNRWQAYIKFQGDWCSLGYFSTEKEAHAAYLVAAKELHGDWNPLVGSIK